MDPSEKSKTSSHKPPSIRGVSNRQEGNESDLSLSVKVLQTFLLTNDFQRLRPQLKSSLESAVSRVKDYLTCLGLTARVVSPDTRSSIHQRYFSSPKTSRCGSPRSRASPTGERMSYQVSKILRRIRRSNNLDERLDLVLIFRRAEKAWYMKMKLKWERWVGCVYWTRTPYLMFTAAPRVSTPSRNLPPPISHQPPRKSPDRHQRSQILKAGLYICAKSQSDRVLQTFLHWKMLTYVSLRMVPWVRTQAVANAQSDNCIAAYYAIKQAVQTIKIAAGRRLIVVLRGWLQRAQTDHPSGEKTSLTRLRESHILVRNLRKSAS